MVSHYTQYEQSMFVKYIKNVNFSQLQMRQQLANLKIVGGDNLVLKITLWREKIKLTDKLGNCLQKYYKGKT